MKTYTRAISLILSLMFVLAMTAVGVGAVDGDAADKAAVKVINSEMDVTVGYKETKCFEFEASGLPEGAAVYVFIDGEKLREDTYVCVNEPTEDFTVEARALDADGETIASSGVIKVTVKNGFFDRLAAFFKNTFGTAADAIADVFSAFFMKIVVFLNGGKLF